MYIVAYRLLNLLNDCEFDSTDAHIAKRLLDMIYEVETRSRIDATFPSQHFLNS